MVSNGLRIGSAWLCLAVIPAVTGCSYCKGDSRTAAFCSENQHPRVGRVAWTGPKPVTTRYSNRDETSPTQRHERTAFAPRPAGLVAFTEDMPSDARSGECFAQIYMPPEFETVSERICVREASEKIEIIPAKYEWIEERVLVKEASTELVEVPARFDVQDQFVQTSPGHATWIKAEESRCAAGTAGPPPQDIFCLVTEPPTTTTIQTERMVQGPTVEKVAVPAEYQTIRRHKLVQPASTRTVSIPAEYREITKTVLKTPGRMEWQRVHCEPGAFQMERDVRPVSDRHR